MLRIDVSSLRLSEVRSLLASARARGQDALAEQLEAELTARASGRAPLRQPDPEPPFENDDVLPIDVGPPLEDFTFELSQPTRAPARRKPIIGLVLAGVVTAGAAVAWVLSGAPGLPGGDSPAAVPTAATAPPPPVPRAMTVRADIAPPAETPPPVEPPAEPAPRTVAEAEPAPPSRLDPCATPPSPADRLLCRDLALNLLEHEMREAYGRAIIAGADPITLRESQADWRRTRDPIADPRALAAAYDRRIRELEAAAAPPPP
ncbi:hypothetical protein [Phenylobacterium sp.]|jgi:hypothetical protein|uniref:hypothetical protein n=1 Tax=Phenylobacterium sp. TaxID=1871053 RepID=UPI002EDB964F